MRVKWSRKRRLQAGCVLAGFLLYGAAMAAGLDRDPFQTVDGVRRCLLFDATEMADHCEFFREVET